MISTMGGFGQRGHACIGPYMNLALVTLNDALADAIFNCIVPLRAEVRVAMARKVPSWETKSNPISLQLLFQSANIRHAWSDGISLSDGSGYSSCHSFQSSMTVRIVIRIDAAHQLATGGGPSGGGSVGSLAESLGRQRGGQCLASLGRL